MGEMQNEAELVVVSHRTRWLWHRTAGQVPASGICVGEMRTVVLPGFSCVLPIGSSLHCLLFMRVFDVLRRAK